MHSKVATRRKWSVLSEAFANVSTNLPYFKTVVAAVDTWNVLLLRVEDFLYPILNMAQFHCFHQPTNICQLLLLVDGTYEKA